MSDASNGGTEQVQAALAVIEAAFRELGWNLTPVHIIKQALK